MKELIAAILIIAILPIFVIFSIAPFAYFVNQWYIYWKF